MNRRRRPGAELALPLAALCCAAGFAVAQVLPETGGGTGVTVRTGLLPDAPPPANGTPDWQFTKSIGVDQEWTDNAVPQTGGRPQASFITVITPSLGITGNSARIESNFLYAPSLYHYESIKGQDYLGQNLSTSTHVTLVPEELFVDLRGFAAEQALNAATGPAGTTSLNRQNQAQTYNVSVTPYAVHRFGSFGTLQAGAALSQTTQTTLGAKLPGSGSTSQTLGAVQESATFTSGEDFGRILSKVDVLNSQSNGNGPERGAYRDTASYQGGYAFSHAVQGLASIGYERISYGGTAPLRIGDMTWSGGVKLLPNPDSSITVQYGHQDGVTALSVDGSYAPTVRTKLFVRYSEGITTGIEQLQNSLAGAQFDPLGNATDSVTGAPLQLTNNFFGLDNTLFHDRSASVTAAWTLDRDSLQATINREDRTPAGAQSGAQSGAAQASVGTYGSLSWQHTITDALRASLFGQYGISDLGSGRTKINSQLVVFSGTLSYALSDTLTGQAQYSYSSDAYSGSIPGQAVNLVVLGLRKTF